MLKEIHNRFPLTTSHLSIEIEILVMKMVCPKNIHKINKNTNVIKAKGTVTVCLEF